MQVQTVNSNGSALGFKANQGPQFANMQQVNQFLSLDDSQLKQIAYEQSYDKNEQKRQKNTLIGFLMAIPLVDTITHGILHKEPILDDTGNFIKFEAPKLGEKVMASISRAKTWGVGLAAFGAFSVVKKAVNSESDMLSDFNNNHPLLSLAVDFGAIVSIVGICNHGFAMLDKKFPSPAKFVSEKLAGLKTYLNSTKINKDMMPKISKFAESFASKAPVMNKIGGFALRYSWALMLGAEILKANSYSNKNKQQVEKNYENLKNEQGNVAKSMVGLLNLKSAILTKQNINLKMAVVKSRVNENILAKKVAIMQSGKRPIIEAQKAIIVKNPNKASNAKSEKTVVIFEQ